MITQRIKTDTSTAENLLNYCSVKQKVLSENIANIGTEGYKRKDVAFKDLLNEATNSAKNIKQTNPKHFPLNNSGDDNNGFEVIEENSQEYQSGVNNVDIDKEMTEMAENSIRFKLGMKRVSGYYKNIQMVIRGNVT